MDIRITGANGFVGRAVCALLASRGHRAVGIVRSPEAAEALPSDVAACPVTDPLAPKAWAQALAGGDAAVHLIARTHRDDASDPAALPLYRETNVTVTEALLEGCVRAGVGRLLFLSSIKAVGEGGFPGSDAPAVYDESSPRRPEDAYGLSKKEAEDRVRTSGLDWTILRPPLIYGPGARGNFRALVEAVRAGRPLPLASIRNARSLLFVGNLAAAVAACLESPAAGGRIFHAADEETPSTPELARLIGETLGRPARLFPVPVALLRLTGAATGRGGAVRKLAGSLVLRTEAIREALGFRPPFSLRRGLALALGRGTDRETEAAGVAPSPAGASPGERAGEPR